VPALDLALGLRMQLERGMRRLGQAIGVTLGLKSRVAESCLCLDPARAGRGQSLAGTRALAFTPCALLGGRAFNENGC
jgi:hypothetical protein